jgi:nicotinamide mononucleotide transporter
MTIELFIEITGAIIGLVYLYLEYKASFWLWTAGIVMSFFYIYIYYHGKFYADMAIYSYYLGANIYGLIVWKNRNQKQEGRGGFSHVPKKHIPLLVAVFLLLLGTIYLILSKFTDSPVAFGDSFTTSLSIIAMWLMAKKHIDHWLLWAVVNMVSCGLYLWKGLYPTSILFVVYTVVSVLGYRKWKQMI